MSPRSIKLQERGFQFEGAEPDDNPASKVRFVRAHLARRESGLGT